MTEFAIYGVTSRVLLVVRRAHQHPTFVFEVMYGEKVIYGAGRGGWAFAKYC